MVRLGYRFVCIGSGSNICFTEDKIIGSYLSLILERDGVKFIVESFNFIGGPKGTIVEKFIYTGQKNPYWCLLKMKNV